MRVLFIKEMLEIRYYLILGLLMNGCLTILVDPLTFSGCRDLGLVMVISAFFMCFFGLMIYSRENASKSMDFMLCRPIKWWWVYITKFLVGLLVCTILTAFAALLYTIVMPPEYRPFMTIRSLLIDAVAFWSILSFGFILGFVASCASSGFAVAIASLSGMLLVTMTLLFGVFHNLGFTYWQFLPLILVLASIFRARLPVVTNSNKRMKVWWTIIIIGFTLYIGANVLFPNYTQTDNPFNSITSPDGKWTAYLEDVDTAPPNTAAVFWMKGLDGQKCEIERSVAPKLLKWLQNGESFLYLSDKSTSGKNGPVYLKISKRSNSWKSEILGKLPPSTPGSRYFTRRPNWIYPETNKLSPSGSKVIFEYDSCLNNRVSSRFVVVDMIQNRTYSIPFDWFMDFWWVDENRIAIQIDKNIRVVPATGKTQ